MTRAAYREQAAQQGDDMRWLLTAVMTALMTQAQAQEESLCNQVEDFALEVLDLKNQGVPEIDIRRALNLQDGDILEKMLTTAYSDDRITPEYMVAWARVQCGIEALFGDERFRPEEVVLEIEPSLPPFEWIEECAQQRWLFDNRKSTGRGTLLRDWNAHPSEVASLAEFMWERRDAINGMDYGPEQILADEAAGELTDYQSEVASSFTKCVVDRIRFEASD